MAERVPDTSWVIRLFDQHRTTVWRYLRYLGCDAAGADDLVQETFLKVFSAPFEDRGEAAAQKYLTLTAKHLFISQHVRRAGRTRELQSIDEIEVADAAWQHTYDTAGGEDPRLDALRSCIAQLSGTAKQAVTLCYEMQRTGPEIADMLGLKEDYVRVLLTRTRQALRDCVLRKTTGQLDTPS
ncbi:MAG: RNA polymerase sigma factor [Planctomycetota bacterium]